VKGLLLLQDLRALRNIVTREDLGNNLQLPPQPLVLVRYPTPVIQYMTLVRNFLQLFSLLSGQTLCPLLLL